MVNHPVVCLLSPAIVRVYLRTFILIENYLSVPIFIAHSASGVFVSMICTIIRVSFKKKHLVMVFYTTHILQETG